MTRLELEAAYAERMIKDIQRNPDKWALGAATPEAYAQRTAVLMINAAVKNGARSINLSDSLRGALKQFCYPGTYVGLERALALFRPGPLLTPADELDGGETP